MESWKAGEAFHWRDEGVRAFEGSSPQPMRVFALSSTYLSADG